MVEAPARALATKLLWRSTDRADDAVQEALIKIFARAHQYEAGRDALTWALSIVAWECRTLRRRADRSRESSVGALPEQPDGAPSPETVTIDRDLWAAVESTFGALSLADRATIEAAWSGEVATATFRKRLERALGRLRGAWRATHGA